MRVTVALCILVAQLLESSTGFSTAGIGTVGRSRGILGILPTTFLASSSQRTGDSPRLVAPPRELDPNQLDFAIGYLNKHHAQLLLKLAEIFSVLGAEMASANVWSGGSVELQSAELRNIAFSVDSCCLELCVDVLRRGKPQSTECVEVSLNAEPIPERQRNYPSRPVVLDDPNRLAIDDFVRRLCRLCWIVGQPEVSGKLMQLAIQLSGAGVGKLPENMYLNQVPHNRYVRKYFYDQAAEAVLEAVILCSQHKIGNRMRVISQFPEMNPSMDSYRIGTILEMVRTMAIKLAEQNIRVRISVQGSMGVGIFTGIPKQLSGVSKLVQMMDWQSDEGQENEGMVGNYVNFGAIGREHVVDQHTDADGNVTQFQDDVFILICPQSMVGTDSSIHPLLVDMVDAAGDRPVILLNPDLTDRPSAAGQQSVRGRKQRIDFSNSFQTIFHFQNIYVSGTSYFPILGAITKLRPSEPWVAHQRRDFTDGGEIYVPILAGEEIPDGEAILNAIK